MRVITSCSKSASASTFLLQLFLQGVVFESLFDEISFVAQLVGKLVHVVLFFSVVAESVVFGYARLAILGLGIIITLVLTSRGLYTDVLAEEVIGCEIVHEVLRSDESSLLVSVLHGDLIKTLKNGLHDLLESEVHGLLLLVILTNLL